MLLAVVWRSSTAEYRREAPTRAIGADDLETASASGCVCDVTHFGAVGDGTRDNTQAFRDAVHACTACAGTANESRPGGVPAQVEARDGVSTTSSAGEVVVPGGAFLTGPFNLSSHMRLTVTPHAVVYAIDNFDAFRLVPPLPSYGSGREFEVSEGSAEPNKPAALH